MLLAIANHNIQTWSSVSDVIIQNYLQNQTCILLQILLAEANHHNQLNHPFRMSLANANRHIQPSHPSRMSLTKTNQQCNSTIHLGCH